MKQLLILILAVTGVLTLTACPDKGKKNGDGTVVASPAATGASCNTPGYYFNHYYNYYTDQAGNRVDCTPGPLGNAYNNNYLPYNQYWNGSYISGCSSWSQVYPGSSYIPVQVPPYGYVCVNTSSFQQIPYYSSYSNFYGGYPSYARSCQYGVNCGSCLGGGGVSAGVNLGGLWLGGTLALCW